MALRATDGDEDAAGAAGRCPPERTLPVRYRAATARERTPLVRYRTATVRERTWRPEHEPARYSVISVTFANPSCTVGGRSLAAMRSTTSSGTTRTRPWLRSRRTASGTSKKTASTEAP